MARLSALLTLIALSALHASAAPSPTPQSLEQRGGGSVVKVDTAWLKKRAPGDDSAVAAAAVAPSKVAWLKRGDGAVEALSDTQWLKRDAANAEALSDTQWLKRDPGSADSELSDTKWLKREADSAVDLADTQWLKRQTKADEAGVVAWL